LIRYPVVPTEPDRGLTATGCPETCDLGISGRPVPRRAVLATGAAGIGAVVVAACGSSHGGAVAVKLPDGKPAVARPGSSTAAAFSAICTQMGCTVNVDGQQLRCPAADRPTTPPPAR
jgi:hypothetical protein